MKKIHLNKKQWMLIAGAFLFVLVLTIIGFYFFNKSEAPTEIALPKGSPFLEADTVWADSLLKQMSVEDKVGQLLILELGAAISEETTVREANQQGFEPGAVCLEPGALKSQLRALSEYRQRCKFPILSGIQAQLGLFFPDDSLRTGTYLPSFLVSGDSTHISNVAAMTAHQLKELGIQLHFAPDLGIIKNYQDADGDPAFASFIDSLSIRALCYMQQQQDSGILVCATDFPNYSDGKNKQRTHADSLSIKPFRELAHAGLSCIQLIHSPGIEEKGSKIIITDSLHRNMSFNGLAISDFRNNSGNPAQTAIRALEALQNGSDMVRISGRGQEVFNRLVEAVGNGELADSSLNARVKKILLAKTWAGLKQKLPQYSDSAFAAFPRMEAELAGRDIIASSLTLVANSNHLLPFVETRKVKTICLSISTTTPWAFRNGLSHYEDVQFLQIKPDATDKEMEALLSKVRLYQRIILAVYDEPGLKENVRRINAFIKKAETGKDLAVVHFGSLESLALLDHFQVLLHAYGSDKITQSYAAQSLYGGVPLQGRLPWNCSNVFCYADGVMFPKATRLRYGIPEESGINTRYLIKIDSVIRQAIKSGVFPGCQVFVACKGNVVLNRSWGYHKYNRETEVRNSDLYDLASVTKVAATTMAIMALYDEGKIRFDTTLNYYFNDLDKNAKGKRVRRSRLNDVTLYQLMTHYSGLPSGLPIARFMSPRWYLKYMKELEKKRLAEGLTDSIDDGMSAEWMIDTNDLAIEEDSVFQWLFSKKKDKDYPVQMGEDMWMRQEVVDSMWDLAKQTALRADRKYVYSDLNFYLVMKVAEAVAKKKLDEFVAKKYYDPLNLSHICFTPIRYFKKEKIVPTEDERGFRNQLIQGFVHDPTAALAGGVGGNAGLFSNAEDLGILLQMLLNKGSYGGKRYLSEKTVNFFTTPREEGYRALGWVHQTPAGIGQMAAGCSPSTYGHTGFTGTSIWVDPDREIVFVFLSNRNYPKSDNKKIIFMQTREIVQQLIYDALGQNAKK